MFKMPTSPDYDQKLSTGQRIGCIIFIWLIVFLTIVGIILAISETFKFLGI